MKHLITAAALAAASLISVMPEAQACSRVVYQGEGDLRIVGRSLDWKTPIPTNIYVYPRGMKKVGNTIPGSVEWTSKYGSVYAVSYDGGVTEGMNEKGLVISGLFCKGTVYVNQQTEGRPPMSLAMFPAWLLDCYATTPEVVETLRKQDFTISGATFDGGTVSALHWGITDAEGRSAILEFVDGQVFVYDAPTRAILTNDPIYPQMLAIENYWEKVGGANMLPGTVKSPDRFVRAHYFDHHVESVSDPNVALAITRSIIQNVSVPYLYTIESEPNVSSTQWRSFANTRDRLYYFDLVGNMGIFYVDLKRCDLRPGASVMKFDTAAHPLSVGDITDQMQAVAPFTPMY